MDALTARYQHAPGLVLEPMGDEALLLDLERNTCFALNPTGLLIWQRVGEGDTLGEVATRLATAFEVDADSSQRDLDAFVGLLLARGLLLPR